MENDEKATYEIDVTDERISVVSSSEKEDSEKSEYYIHELKQNERLHLSGFYGKKILYLRSTEGWRKTGDEQSIWIGGTIRAAKGDKGMWNIKLIKVE